MIKNSKDIQHQLKNFQCPLWDDLPDLALYMDQTIALINDTLDPLLFDTDNTLITKSMVNNYVKNSILHPPVKKHYKKYHIAFLIVVVILKRCYSLAEISQMIQIYWDMNDQRINLHYDTFIHYFTSFLHEIMTTGNTPNIDYDKYSFEQTLMIHVILTVVNKIYSEYLLIKDDEKRIS